MKLTCTWLRAVIIASLFFMSNCESEDSKTRMIDRLIDIDIVDIGYIESLSSFANNSILMFEDVLDSASYSQIFAVVGRVYSEENLREQFVRQYSISANVRKIEEYLNIADTSISKIMRKRSIEAMSFEDMFLGVYNDFEEKNESRYQYFKSYKDKHPPKIDESILLITLRGIYEAVNHYLPDGKKFTSAKIDQVISNLDAGAKKHSSLMAPYLSVYVTKDLSIDEFEQTKQKMESEIHLWVENYHEKCGIETARYCSELLLSALP